MKRLSTLTVILIIVGYGLSWPTIINIPADWPTIQQGINVSSDGDSVLVQPGIYVENVNFNGHNIVLGSLFLMTGDTSYIEQTVIDGDSAGSVMTFENGENGSAMVTGFTIRNGYSQQGGGGIYCYDNSNPTISHNYICENYSVGGGGICCHHQCAPIIVGNIITNNMAQIGGGLHIQGSDPTVISNTINYNQADLGGSISCASSNPIINRSIIVGNTAIMNGGGLYCFASSDPTIINCTITENSAHTGGAAFYINSNSTITNSILWANIASIEPGIYFENSSFVITYCDIEGGWQGAGNINIDPMFRNPSNADYRLMAIDCSDPYDSPCIDVGWPAVADSIVDCNWGLGTTLCDLGAYGGGRSTQSGIINVPGDFPTIQEGIAASGDGDTVLVQPGTYVENINFNGHNIVLGSLFLITGDITYISSTIIDGDSLSPVIIIENGEDNNTVITGFTIQNGLGLGPPYWYGGGIVCRNYSSPIIEHNYIINNSAIYGAGGIDGFQSNPTIKCNTIINNFGLYGGGVGLIQYSNGIIDSNLFYGNSAACGGGISSEGYNQVISNNTVVGNSADGFGGGMWLGGNLTVLNNTIIENLADRGGGIDIGADNALVEGNVICRNIADSDGGGMYVYCSEITITRNMIYDNSCNNEGGGICCWRHHPDIGNNLIVGNHANNGGGISCYWGTNPSITNNTIASNNAAELGGGLFCGSSSIPLIKNTIFWGDSAMVSGNEIYSDVYDPIVLYCDIEGGWPGVGNIDNEPLFRNPANGDFHLMSIACGDSADSPCIDAGDPNYSDSLLDCSLGLGTTASDMGAYGGGDSAMVGIIENIPSLPGRIMLMQNYPNPFNATTIIRFMLPEPQEVNLTIYNLLGRQVQTLINDHRPAGSQTVTFDASNLSSGVYFYRLQTGDVVETKRMVLLK